MLADNALTTLDRDEADAGPVGHRGRENERDSHAAY